MARLIDADELKSKLQGHKDYFVDGWGGFDKMSFATKCRVDEIDNCIAEIVNAPTIDAVPVVRGKDCTQYNGHRYCRYLAETMLDNDFCSYGTKRRTDERKAD